MNARFWVWWNDDWVKLTLKPGAAVHLYESHQTDEGYSFQDELYKHEGEYVVCHSTSGGSDCDGPIERHSVCECHLQYLTPSAEPLCPPWTRVRAWQRDAYAEAMGY